MFGLDFLQRVSSRVLEIKEALGFKRKTSDTMLSVSQEMVWGGGILQVSMDNRRPLLDMNLGVY